MKYLNLRDELFWDIHPDKLDEEENKRLIIERALSFGNLMELKAMFRYYGKETLKDEITKIGYLDPKTFEFVVSYFGINKEEMKCFTKKLLHQTHWH